MLERWDPHEIVWPVHQFVLAAVRRRRRLFDDVMNRPPGFGVPGVPAGHLGWSGL